MWDIFANNGSTLISKMVKLSKNCPLFSFMAIPLLNARIYFTRAPECMHEDSFFLEKYLFKTKQSPVSPFVGLRWLVIIFIKYFNQPKPADKKNRSNFFLFRVMKQELQKLNLIVIFS